MDDLNIKTLENFTLEDIPNLDTVVLAALELFQKVEVKSIDLARYKRPLVVGSGNAEATGRIIFKETDAVFASESTYEEHLKNIESIDGVVIISASGGKHAPIIARKAKELGKHVTLITTRADSNAKKELALEFGDTEFVFPKNREPYTYNTSPYMGMILSYTKEDPTRILTYIREVIDTIDMTICSQYEKFYIIVPPQFSSSTRMLEVKFIELFGRIIARDVETFEYVKHATTVIPSKELFISFGYENTTWGKEGARINIPLPEWANYGAMMAISYYVVGKIQKHHPPYFKQNIEKYTQDISKIFNETILPIVE